MNRLSESNLPRAGSEVDVFSYTRNKISSGIVHFGVGNFHRTHQAIYCENLLCQGEKKWGITGVSMRSPKMRDALSPQDYLYTQVNLGDEPSYRIVGAINTILVASEDPEAVIDAVAAPSTQLVTTTITEKAYYLEAGSIDFEQSDLLADLASLESPKTIFGYLAAAIIKRKRNSGPPLTILCCDNIRTGGSYLKKGVDKLLSRHCAESQLWANQKVSFISSMVDRISPATDTLLKAQLEASLNLIDEWPVGAEPFSQWVIEDNFRGEKPPFDQVGALLVKDVSSYEETKLRFLNAAHSVIATLGYIHGDRYVHEALRRRGVLNFVKHLLVYDVAPVVTVPPEWDVHSYIEQIIARFSNAAIPYSLQQVNTDSSQKICQRWLSTVEEALTKGKCPTGYAFAMAAWIYYIYQSSTKNDLHDPLAQDLSDIVHSEYQIVGKVLSLLSDSDSSQLNLNDEFVALTSTYFNELLHQGLPSTLTQFLINQTSQS